MKKILTLVIISLTIIACSEGSDEISTKDKTEPQSAEARRAEIDSMEADLLSSKDITAKHNQVKADLLVKRYRDYVSMNPRDSISADYLFKAADLSIGLSKYDASLKYLDRLTDDFPQYEKIVEIWLFKGFVYETYLNNHAQAVKAYETLIEKYPNHRLAKDAQASIDNLTLTEEELLEKLKAAAAKAS